MIAELGRTDREQLKGISKNLSEVELQDSAEREESLMVSVKRDIYKVPRAS